MGPDAPTLCEGWTARDLAAHLVVRDRRPDAIPGILVPALASYTKKVQDARSHSDYAQLVADVRTGPGRLSPMTLAPVNERVNLIEYATHAEDVRRAQPHAMAATLPPLPEGVGAAIWKNLTTMGKILVRSRPVGVSVHAPNFGDAALKQPQTQGGVTLTGSPTDLLMHLSGRGEHSNVSLMGQPEAINAFTKVKLGL